MPYTPSTVPDNVPKKYAAQFSEVWNSAYAAAIADKKSPAQAEETAFAQAHGVILKAKQKDERDVSSDGPGFGPTETKSEDGGQVSDPQQSLRGKKDKQPRDKKGRFGSDKYVNTFKKGDRLSDGKRSVTLLDYTTSRATVRHDDGETEQVESIELRYSEDQPRDEHGKFGSGGNVKENGRERSYLGKAVERRFAEDQLRGPDGKFASNAGENAHTTEEHLKAQSEHVGKAREALKAGDRETAKAHGDAAAAHSKAAFALSEEKEAVGGVARVASKVANDKSGIGVRSEQRYSEDQPREPNGEFGSGGGDDTKEEMASHMSYATELKEGETADKHVSKYSTSPAEAKEALAKGELVYAKNKSDWIKIDKISDDGTKVRVADALDGFNDGTVGKWFVPRDVEKD